MLGFQIQELKPSPNDKHRENKSDNPLTYFERFELIRDSLFEAGLTPNQFAIMPFPIDTPQLLQEFIPTNITLFTTVNDSWNEHKIDILKEYGYDVVVLWERKKGVVGSNVRELIYHDNPKWVSLVPKSVASYLERINIANRIKSLKSIR